MNISKQEAHDSLTEIESIISQTRREIMGRGAAFLLIMWGAIWMIGFSGVQFFPKLSGQLWLALDLTGFIATWIRIKRSARQRPGNSRVGLAWLVVLGYIVLWSILLNPNRNAGMAFFSTVPMCCYVIFGLWVGRFWVWLGLIVTALTVAGLFLLPAWFPLWMAITGGGSLILSGVFIRTFWK